MSLQLDPEHLKDEEVIELTASELCYQFHELKKNVSIMEKKIERLEEQ